LKEIRFPAYRHYVSQRQEANNAIVALLAGSRLAFHTLQLTEGSDNLLSEIFPAVPHIKHFNLRTESARTLLLNADSHLGAITVPYALALHEDFLMTVLEWLNSVGFTLDKQGKAIKAWNMHEVLFRTLQVAPPSPSLSLLHLLRHMRNAQIHEGGRVPQSLRDYIQALPADRDLAWTKLTGRPLKQTISQDSIEFTSGDIFASFALTKRVGRDINYALQSAGIAPSIWCELATEDFSKYTDKFRNSDNWMRALWGYAKQFYGDLSLSESDLEDAAIRLGLWTRGKGVVPPRKLRTSRTKGGSSH